MADTADRGKPCAAETQQRAEWGTDSCLGHRLQKKVDDMRESPTLKLMQFLENRRAWVDYFDPYIPEIPKTREHPEFAGRASIAFGPFLVNMMRP